jgi:hypothetical protein
MRSIFPAYPQTYPRLDKPASNIPGKFDLLIAAGDSIRDVRLRGNTATKDAILP